MKNFSIFKMGLTFLLLLSGIGLRALAADNTIDAAAPQNYDVSLTVKSATVESFTKAFTKQTGVVFSYESSLATMSLGDVTVDQSAASLEQILQSVFGKRGFKYQIVNRVVVLTPPATEPQTSKEKRIIRGTVSDESGQPMIGATVIVKGSTTRGTTTAADGGYSIAVQAHETLIFAFMGCVDQEIPVGNRSVINTTLKEDQQMVDEIVVVGYGTQARKTVTAAITKFDGKALEGNPVNSIGDGLKGRLAGVRVATVDATPGADPKFLVRGGSSINQSNDPIILVDGVQREMTGLNPNDIESISVLKDAASAGIYGARASNGVVLITTKKGSKYKGPQITFEGQWALSTPATKFDLMNAKDYIKTMRPAIAEGYCGGADPITVLNGAESAGTGNTSPTSLWTTRYLQKGESLPSGYGWVEDPINPGKIIIFKDSDQQSQWFDNSLWQNYYVGINGGGDNIQYAASAGYTDDGGIGIATGFSRFTFHGNTAFQVTKRLKASTTFDYSQIEQQSFESAPLNLRNSVIRGLSVPATHRDWYGDDAGADLSGKPVLGVNNTTLPAAYYNYYYKEGGSTVKRSSVNLNLEWEIIDGLRLVGQFTTHNRHTRSNFYVKNNPTTGANVRPMKEGFSETNRVDFQTYANYKKLFGKHSLDLVAGYDYMKDKVNSFDVRVQGAVSDKLPVLDAGTSNVAGYPKSARTEECLISYFGRANYDYDERYMLSLTLRVDGSSKFATDNRWGYFPAASAGWSISDEAFWPQNKAVSSLKARLSYGLTGNNGIGLYDTYGSYNSSGLYNGNSTTQTGTMPNESLTWEKTAQFDAGLDVGFFNNRIQVTVDYYNKVTRDLLFDVKLPNTTGYETVTTNLGKVRFYGAEFSISSLNITHANFSWRTDFSYNYNMNRVLKLPDNGNGRNRIGGISVGNGSQFGGIAEGERLGRIYGYVVDHILETQAQADAAMYDVSSRGYRRSDRQQIAGRKDVGDYEWVNRPGSTQQSGNDIINAEDQFLLGYALPHSTGGLGNTFKYKNWSLNIYVDYALGHSIDNNMQMRYFQSTMGNCNYNLVNAVKDCWQKPGDNTKYARFTANDPDWGNRNYGRRSNVFVQKGDYLCIRDIAISYSLPKSWLKKLHMNDVTFTVSGNTLYYWTAVEGVSPEAATSGSLYSAASTYDTDYNPYPPTRKILFSAKFTF